MPRKKTTTRKKKPHPSKLLNKALIRKMKTAIRHGASMKGAAAHVGIHPHTIYQWSKKGRQDERDGKQSIEREFIEGVREARGKMETDLVRYINDAAASNWKAAQYILEKRAVMSWGADPPSLPDPDDIEVDSQKVVDPHADQRDQILARFRAAQGGDDS